MSRITARTTAMQLIYEKLSGGQGGEDSLRMVYDELRQDGVPGGNDEALGTVSAAKPGKSAKSKSDKIIAAEQINEKGDRA